MKFRDLIAKYKLHILAFSLVLIMSILGSYFYFAQKNNQAGLNSPSAAVLAAQSDISSAQPIEDLKTLSILLLGYGGAGHDGGFLTDVIQILHINFETNQVALISIPRDLWVKLPNGQESKINAAFTLGDNQNQLVESGAVVAKQMAATVTGLPIQYYIAVDFVGFQRLIGENLKGIEVQVNETLDDPWYPIKGEEVNTCGMTAAEVATLSATYSGFELEKQFPCRYEHVLVHPGKVAMHGGEALKYVRSRHGSGAGDFSRSRRQHEVLEGLKNKLISLDALNTVQALYEPMIKNVHSDINLDLAKYLAPTLKQIQSTTITKIVLSTDNVFKSGQASTGQSIILPKSGLNNWQETQSFIQQQLTE